MHPSIAADLASAFNDPFATVDITLGDVLTHGFENVADQISNDNFGEPGQVRARIVSIYTGTLGDELAQDAEITVDGVSYSVREVALSDDGLMQHIQVAG